MNCVCSWLRAAPLTHQILCSCLFRTLHPQYAPTSFLKVPLFIGSVLLFKHFIISYFFKSTLPPSFVSHQPCPASLFLFKAKPFEWVVCSCRLQFFASYSFPCRTFYCEHFQAYRNVEGIVGWTPMEPPPRLDNERSVLFALTYTLPSIYPSILSSTHLMF